MEPVSGTRHFFSSPRRGSIAKGRKRGAKAGDARRIKCSAEEKNRPELSINKGRRAAGSEMESLGILGLVSRLARNGFIAPKCRSPFRTSHKTQLLSYVRGSQPNPWREVRRVRVLFPKMTR
ncbi:hypothetical protein AVEN_56360-1 [Araneus ventricosus]|uniref:Uncharacterized protein n=1 Tax=Araneus ventricosus TaxID=182803 RepID=A0A4Y2LPH0_ARAVE|nr:hypothetical protein AVEN_56360-1 [Araneus ventricosus]